MTKTNYTKVEESLAEGLRKMEVERLLSIADTNQPLKPSRTKEPIAPLLTPEQKQLLSFVKHEIKMVKKEHVESFYKKLEVERSVLKRYIKEPESIKTEDWKKLQEIKDKILTYKEEIANAYPQKKDDEVIEKERKEQKTKRFNINKNWIPLK